MNKIKRYIVTTVMALAMILPIIQPLAVHAEETAGQVISITSNYAYDNYEEYYSYTLNIKEGYSEIVGYYVDHYTGANGVQYKNQCLKLGAYDAEFGKFVDWTPNFKEKWISSYTAHTFTKKDGDMINEAFDTQAGLSDCSENNFITKIIDGYYTRVNCTWSGIKVFETKEDAQNYINTGSTNGLVEPPKTGLDKEWYLKNIGYSVRAEDGGENEDATFIKFTWDTDNLQDDDLIEIRTHNWYRTLTGNQFSGFHDYITFENGVSAMNGSYEISQYEATNAWFKSLDNTPLVFKSFDTDTYYLRPYRNGVYGGWVRISMKRNPAIKGTPYVNNVEYGDFDEETGDFVIDNDRTQTEGGYGITQKGEPVLPNEYDGLNNVGTVITTAGDALKYFFSNITSVMGLFGQLPQLLNAVIGWLPSPLIVLICASVVVVIILRIFGR